MIRKLQFGSGTEIPEFQAFKHSAPSWHGVSIMTAMKVRMRTLFAALSSLLWYHS